VRKRSDIEFKGKRVECRLPARLVLLICLRKCCGWWPMAGRKIRIALRRANDAMERRIGRRRAPFQPLERDETDYQQRHFANLAAVAFLLALAIGITATVQMFDRQFQLERCLLMGRKDCVDVAAGAPHRMIAYRPREPR